MNGEEIFYLVQRKLNERYIDIGDFYGKIRSKHSVVFSRLVNQYAKSEVSVKLGVDEFPLFESLLPNGNYFLMSTKKMISLFQRQRYELMYANYRWHDQEYFQNALPFMEGDSKVLKYYSSDNAEFFYEVESGLTFDVAHNAILYFMRKLYLGKGGIGNA